MELSTFDLALQAVVSGALKAIAAAAIGFGLLNVWELLRIRRG